MVKPGEMIYNGFNFKDLFVVEDVDRPQMPPIDVKLTERDGIDGAEFDSASFNSKTINVTIGIHRPFEKLLGLDGGFERARRLINNHLYTGKPEKLILPDAPDLYEMAILNGTLDIEKFVYYRREVLTFVCPKAYSYSAKRTRVCDSGSKYVHVKGNATVYPVTTVQANGTFMIEFDGKPFETVEEVTGNVVIDAKDRLVTCDGNPVRYSLFNDLPEWQPGRHQVECPFPFKVEWVERWR